MGVQKINLIQKKWNPSQYKVEVDSFIFIISMINIK